MVKIPGRSSLCKHIEPFDINQLINNLDPDKLTNKCPICKQYLIKIEIDFFLLCIIFK